MSGEGFSLKGSSDEFSQKCKNLFDFSAIKKSDCSFAQEKAQEQKNKDEAASGKDDGAFKVPSLPPPPPPAAVPSAKKQRPDREIYRPTKKAETPNCNSFDSKFQRNRGRGGFNNRLPDHKKNPQNYTKYSLKDVDTSAKANAEAAFSFLREIDERKRKSELDAEGGAFDTSENQKGKITFKKKAKKPKESEKPSEEEAKKPATEEELKSEEGEKPAAKNEEGEKPAAKTSKKKKDKNITLSHLMDDEED